MKPNLFSKLRLYLIAILTMNVVSAYADVPPITVSPEELLPFIAAEREQEFTITANSNVTVTWTVKSDVDWLKLNNSYEDSTSPSTVIVKASANNTTGSRNAIITILASWESEGEVKTGEKTLSVYQAAPRLFLSESGTITISKEDQDFTFETINTNVDWSYSISQEGTWLTPTTGSNKENHAVTLHAVENSGGERTATITVTAVNGPDSPEKSFTIIQQGTVYTLSVEPETLEFGQGGGDLPFYITSNTNWTVTIPESDKSWLSIVDQTGTKL